jgi:hypothetical protein
VFACGRVINPKTARSQLIGGMTMGISTALLEESVLDPRLGGYVNQDLASYHVATHADVGDVDATWVDEEDLHVSPIGLERDRGDRHRRHRGRFLPTPPCAHNHDRSAGAGRENIRAHRRRC